MNQFNPTDAAIFAMALAIFYAGWHEYKTRNQRDAKLLATLGALCLIGGSSAWLQ